MEENKNMFDEESEKFNNILFMLVIALTIFIVGVQVGTIHGKELQKMEYYDNYLAD